MSFLTLDPKYQPPFDGVAKAQALVYKLSAQKQVIKAFLFGSCVGGKNTENSDIDILVVIPDGTNLKDYYKVVTAPYFSDTATDWIFKTAAEYAKEKDLGGVAFVATQTGLKLKIHGSV